MNKVTDKIIGAMANFEHKLGQRARFIYLGHEEVKTWEAEMQTHLVSRGGSVGGRRTFNGAEIFRVDAKNHLGVSA